MAVSKPRMELMEKCGRCACPEDPPPPTLAPTPMGSCAGGGCGEVAGGHSHSLPLSPNTPRVSRDMVVFFLLCFVVGGEQIFTGLSLLNIFLPLGFLSIIFLWRSKFILDFFRVVSLDTSPHITWTHVLEKAPACVIYLSMCATVLFVHFFT